MTRNSYDAPEVPPTKVSPLVNSPATVATISILVDASQVLTLAVVLLEEPVTISLKTNVPEPILSEPATTMVGATEYPTPAFVM